jgi:hypothetical protein
MGLKAAICSGHGTAVVLSRTLSAKKGYSNKTGARGQCTLRVLVGREATKGAQRERSRCPGYEPVVDPAGRDRLPPMGRHPVETRARVQVLCEENGEPQRLGPDESGAPEPKRCQ